MMNPDNPVFTLTISQLESLVETAVQKSLPEYTPLKFYTREEAAELLSISERSLDSYIKQGIIPAHRLGKKVLIFAEELKSALPLIPVRRA